MLFNVPQYTDVEDKVAGPLTIKQLGWMILMAFVIFVLYNVVPVRVIFYIAAVPVVIFFLMLAFYRPYNMSMGALFLSGVRFLFRPKVYVWKREADPSIFKQKDDKPEVIEKKVPQKKALMEDIESLARLVDTEGLEANRRIMEIIKERHKK